MLFRQSHTRTALYLKMLLLLNLSSSGCTANISDVIKVEMQEGKAGIEEIAEASQTKIRPKDAEWVTDDTFTEKVLMSETPVLVEFWAEWCGPCRQLDPILKEIASEWAGKVVIYKFDVDTSSHVYMDYGVMSIPTLILFRDGEAIARRLGYSDKKILIEYFQPYLR